MFEQTKAKEVQRGDFIGFFTKASRLRRYAAVVFIGVPIWFVIGILILLSPELGKDMGMQAPDSHYVEVYLNELTRKHALGADSPMGQYVINVAVAVFLASLLAVFLSIVLS